MLGKIYTISNSINNKLYVGKTCVSLADRLQQHKHEYKKYPNRILYKAMSEIGVDKFSINLIGEYKESELDIKESNLIKTLNTFEEGYNSTLGGEGRSIIDRNSLIKSFIITNNVAQSARELKIDAGHARTILRSLGYDTTHEIHFIKNSKAVRIIELDRIFNSIEETAEYLIKNNFTNTTNVKSIKVGIARAASGSRKSYLKLTFEYMLESPNGEGLN
jgi:hypothetical protein